MDLVVIVAVKKQYSTDFVEYKQLYDYSDVIPLENHQNQAFTTRSKATINYKL